jgi:hypothetical protein
MDNLLSINHGQRPGVELMNVETSYPTDASALQNVKYDVSEQDFLFRIRAVY